MSQLTFSQRIQIAEGIRSKQTDAQIARMLGMHRSTIGREIKRNAESREKYAARFAHSESQNRQREAIQFRKMFGGGVSLFSVLDKHKAVYPYLSESHPAFFIPFSYLRLNWINDPFYNGPIDSHIYSISRVPDYRLSNLLCIEATGIILPYEKKSGKKVIYKSGQSQSHPTKETDEREVKVFAERELHDVFPRIKHGDKKDCMAPRIKHGGKKDCVVDDEAEKSAAFLFLLLVYTIPYAYFLIIPLPARPSCPFLILILRVKSLRTLFLKNS